MRFFLDGEGEATAAGAEPLRFREATAGDFTEAEAGVVAADDWMTFACFEARAFLDGEETSLYENCFSDAPKMVEDSLVDMITSHSPSRMSPVMTTMDQSLHDQRCK